VCHVENNDIVVLFANGPELRAYDLHKKEEMDVVDNEKRVQAIDFDPRMEYVFWIDSYDNTIKRSFMVKAKEGKAKIGHAQNLNMKSTFYFEFFPECFEYLSLKAFIFGTYHLNYLIFIN